MATFRGRFPSRAQMVLVYASCVTVVFSWSTLWFLDHLTGWLFYLDTVRILSILAYGEAFALVESVTLLAVSVLLSAMLPRSMFRDRFAEIGTAGIILTALWAVLIQYNDETIRLLSVRSLVLFVLAYLSSILAVALAVSRSVPIQKAIDAMATRLVILLYLYVPVGLLSVLAVIVRNR